MGGGYRSGGGQRRRNAASSNGATPPSRRRSMRESRRLGNSAKSFKGVPASPGYAVGRVLIYRQPTLSNVTRESIPYSEATAEMERLEHALGKSIKELAAVKEQVLAELGEAESCIFDTHLSLLEDEQFRQRIYERIRHELINVEHALASEVASLEKVMSSLENEYLRERSMDFRDIGNRVLRNLRDERTNPLNHLPPGSIVLATMLTPSDTIALDRENVVGLITESGGDTSHAAILARSLEIPAVTGVADLLASTEDGDKMLLDGKRGTVTVDPTPHQERRLKSRQNAYHRTIDRAREAEQHECRTRDGFRIRLLSNANRESEILGATEHHMDGVGLFRTEFLFTKAKSAPRLSHQTRLYQRGAELVDPMPMTVRTFDLGGDKRPAFLSTQQTSSNYLRLRGLRFALKEKHLFRTQLRAVVRAHREQENIRILLPMVVSRGCIVSTLEVLRSVAEQEGAEKLPALGAMLETPASIFELNGILDLVDFVSVGTNDLSQYMFAADRACLDMANSNVMLTPAMVRALRQVAETCARRRRPACVCGEAAGDPALALLLVGLGFRELSMSPARAPSVHFALRQMTLQDAQSLAQRVLCADHQTAIVKAMAERLPESVLNLSAALPNPNH